MAQKVSQFPASTNPPNTADLLPIVQGGITKQTTLGALFSQLLGFLPSGILPPNQATRTVNAKLSDVLNVLDAKNNDGTSVAGNGVQDDTTGIAAAIASGKKIVFPSGYTFLVSGLTVSTAGQIIEAWGSTIKLKTASSADLLVLNASGATVLGGTWDVNNVTQNGVHLNADYCSCQFATVQNCGATGISGGVNANFLTIQRNTVKDAVLYGIFVGGGSPAADLTGTKIIDNDVDTSGTATAHGIYLVGKTDGTTFFQKRWNVSRNRVNGTTNGGATTAGITVRGIQGVYEGNQVTGYLLQHTLDITSDSTISGNRGTDPASTGTTCGLEINGARNTIIGNKLKGHSYGIISTGSSPAMDHNVISCNQIDGSTVNGIYISPNGAGTARYLNISDNNIDMSAASSGLIGILLQNTGVSNTVLCGNIIRMRGSAVANTRGMYFDTLPAAGFIHLAGNKIIGAERATTIYNGGAVTHTDFVAIGNDISNDVSTPTNLFSIEGSAIAGARIIQLWNPDNNGAFRNYFDRATNLQIIQTTSSPEGAITAGIGSLYLQTNGSNTTTLWVKESGTGNTGWKKVQTNQVSADNGNNAATLTVGTQLRTQIWATAITADRAVTLDTTGAMNGDRWRIVRKASATGAFNLNVGTGPLKAMGTAGSFCEVEYDGSAWILSAYGVL